MAEEIQKYEVPETTEVQIQDSNNMVLIAMQKGYDPAFIEKMMDLSERNEKNIARQAYHKAMAAFKANPPEIEKDKKVGFDTQKGRTEYSHASLANVCNKINGALSKHGLSASWRTEQNEGIITVTCTITHELGHSESTSLMGAPDLSGNKNAIQAVGSTISYLERYTILALTGLATSDMDDDAGSPDQVITEKQAIEIDKLLRESEKDAVKFLAYFDADTINDIKANKYAEAIKFLKAAIKNKEKK